MVQSISLLHNQVTFGPIHVIQLTRNWNQHFINCKSTGKLSWISKDIIFCCAIKTQLAIEVVD